MMRGCAKISTPSIQKKSDLSSKTTFVRARSYVCNYIKAKNKIKLELSGRYLVRASEEELNASDEEKRNTLIDLNSEKQEALTAYLNGVSVVEKIERKVFSIEGKGDLFGKYFTHFEYEITTNL